MAGNKQRGGNKKPFKPIQERMEGIENKLDKIIKILKKEPD